MTTQTAPDGEAIRIKRSEALAEIKAHVYTLESTLKTSIKANGQFVAEIIALKAERDAALARVEELERTGRDLATGIGVHNDRKIDRHMPIQGAVVSAFLAALTKDQSNDT